MPSVVGLGSLIVASGAAGLAIHEAVGAETDVDHRLTQAAVFFALAVPFRLLTLSAAEFGCTGSGIHILNRSGIGKWTERDRGNGAGQAVVTLKP